MMLWTPEQCALRAKYEAFGQNQLAPRVADHYAERRFDRQSWQTLADLGFWRLPMPREYGGHGGSWWDFAVAFEGLSRTGRDLGFRLSIIAHAGFMRSLLTFGTEDQRHYYLPRLMGGAVGATAMTESTGGSDVSRIRTSAQEQGGMFRLDGQKWHITNAPVADLIMVLARVPALGEKRDITIFLVDGVDRGLRRGEAEHMLGNPTSPTGNLYFDDVVLPPERIVGHPGDGLTTIYNTISLDRLLYGLLAASYLEPILEEAMTHGHARQAFGEAIADFQYVQGRLTDIKIAIETTRSISYTALDQLVSGHPDAVLTCSIAKMTGAEALAQCTQHVMRLYGHMGYMDGPVANSVRDALGTLIAGGTSEMQRKNIFNQMRRSWTAATFSSERVQVLT